MKSHVYLVDEKLRITYDNLKTSTGENKLLYKWLSRAMDDLAQNSFCGIHIQKKLIPKEYVKKYDIDNLWKYDLPIGWRLIYTIKKEEVLVVSIILEWFDHKEYDRRFGY